MIAIQIIDNEVFVASFHKGFLGKGKKLLLVNSLENLHNKKGVIVLPMETSLVSQEAKFKQDLEKAKVKEEDALFFSTSTDKSSGEQRKLVITILKKQLSLIWEKATALGFEIQGVIPEALVLARLLRDHFTKDEKFLVLNIGKEYSRIYLLGSYGMEAAYPEVILTSHLIPKTQNFIKEYQEKSDFIKKAVFYGEESFAFDRKIFEQQTGLELIEADKIIKNYLFKENIIQVNNIAGTSRFVPVITATVLLTVKNMVKINKNEIGTASSEPLVLGEKKVSRFRLILVSLGVALMVVGLILGGLRFVNKGAPLKVVTPTVTQVPTTPILPTETPTPTPEFKPKDIKIRVLNGSGIKGKAKEIGDLIKEMDFDVVELGNASDFDFEESQLNYKKGEKEKADFVIESLADEFKIATQEASLEKDDKIDIEIVIGSE